MRRSSTGWAVPGQGSGAGGPRCPQAPALQPLKARGEKELAGTSGVHPDPEDEGGNGTQEREGDLPKVQVDPRPLSQGISGRFPGPVQTTEPQSC